MLMFRLPQCNGSSGPCSGHVYILTRVNKVCQQGRPIVKVSTATFQQLATFVRGIHPSSCMEEA